MSSFESNLKNNTISKTSINFDIDKSIKNVKFDRRVTLFPVPSRDDLQALFNDLWYTSEEILYMEKKAFKKLNKIIQ